MSMTYNTRRLTARDHQLIDALERSGGRYARVAHLLRPPTPPPKAAPKPAPKAAGCAGQGRTAQARAQGRPRHRRPSRATWSAA